MLQVARLAPRHLADATDRVRAFFEAQLNDDGGGKDRAGNSDLYYTVFVLEGLIAMQQELPCERVTHYLQTFGDGAELDLVHLCCLARCWAAMPGPPPPGLARNLERFRSQDGGYAAETGAASGTVYHGFMAVAAHQDIDSAPADMDAVAESIEQRPWEITTITAAAVTLLRYLGRDIPPAAAAFLLAQRHDDGGFLAVPGAPMPDLLSTATALHALAGLHVEIDFLRESCLDFIDTLWTGQGFCGNWADDVVDSEYSYYGLLALGHLSV